MFQKLKTVKYQLLSSLKDLAVIQADGSVIHVAEAITGTIKHGNVRVVM